jgi:hypothetical protein
LGALYDQHHLDLVATGTRRLLENVAADSDNSRLAIGAAPRRDGGVVLSKTPVGGLAEKAFILDRNIWGLMLGILVFKAPGKTGSRVGR